MSPMNKTLAILCTAALGCLATPNLPAEPAPSANSSRVALFNGKNLEGWDVLKCDAAVEDGSILIKGGNGVIQTKKQYKDYVFECEWKSLKADNWDSGVYFRYTSIPTNEPWPRRYQVNLRKGDEGNVSALKGAKSEGLFKPGEWNKFKLTVRGTAAVLEMNGKPAWTADGLEDPQGFISLQCEVPGGGQCLFRNVFVAELTPAKP